MKALDYIWFWLIMLFAGYVMIASSPEIRIMRVCEPINWAGRLFESVTMVVLPEKASSVHSSMASAEKSCQGVIFRQMYPSTTQKIVDGVEGAATAAGKQIKEVVNK